MQFTNSSIISWDDHLLFIQTIILSSGSQFRKRKASYVVGHCSFRNSSSKFGIRKGSHNTNADALSRCFSVAATGVVHGPTRDELLQAQLADPILSHLVTSFQKDSIRPQGGLWKQPQYRRWLQLWPSLSSKMVYCTGTI